MAEPTRTVTISVPPDLASDIDRQAEAEGRSRSELYREAARQYLRRKQRWEQIFAYGKEVAARSQWGPSPEGMRVTSTGVAVDRARDPDCSARAEQFSRAGKLEVGRERAVHLDRAVKEASSGWTPFIEVVIGSRRRRGGPVRPGAGQGDVEV